MKLTEKQKLQRILEKKAEILKEFNQKKERKCYASSK
jgi:hypothetical protein